jgi:AcrR family transcriptional regulator
MTRLVATPADAGNVAIPPPLATIRDEQRDLTRRRLIAAAQLVFEKDGYGGATVGKITTQANVNRATFYLHFPGKAEVFMAVVDHALADTAQYWRNIDKALMRGTVQAVREALEYALAWYSDHGPLLPAVREAAATDLTVAARRVLDVDLLATEVTEFVATFPPSERDDIRLKIRMLMVQFDQICFRSVVQGVYVTDRGHLLDLLAGMWIDVLVAPYA